MTEYKFYKLVKNEECFYVGKTKAQYVEMRLGTHIVDYWSWRTTKNHRPLCYYNDDFSFNGVTIHEIDKGMYEDERASRQKENEHIREINPPKQKPNKTRNPNYEKEYREQNKEILAQKAFERYQKKYKEKRKIKKQCSGCDRWLSGNSRHENCNPNFMIYPTGEGKFRFRSTGRPRYSENFETLLEAKIARKKWMDKQQGIESSDSELESD
jgi:hypothetical protein